MYLPWQNIIHISKLNPDS